MSEAEAVFMKLLAEGVFSIDEEGRIWRHRRWVPGPGGTKKRVNWILKDIPATRPEGINEDGYWTVEFRVHQKRWGARSHRLVWMAATGNDLPSELEINHKDGVRSNNHPNNLEAVTPSENQYHSFRTLGRKTPPRTGESNSHHMLNDGQVMEIRLLAGKKTYREIGLTYGLNPATVGKIILRRSWNHLETNTPVPSSTGHPRLKAIQVTEIRKLRGRRTYPEIARIYGISTTTVYRILFRKTWKNLK